MFHPAVLSFLGGGFKYFLFSPLFGEDYHFDYYFSKGLKPPTSDYLLEHLLVRKEFVRRPADRINEFSWLAGEDKSSVNDPGLASRKRTEPVDGNTKNGRCIILFFVFL